MATLPKPKGVTPTDESDLRPCDQHPEVEACAAQEGEHCGKFQKPIITQNSVGNDQFTKRKEQIVDIPQRKFGVRQRETTEKSNVQDQTLIPTVMQ